MIRRAVLAVPLFALSASLLAGVAPPAPTWGQDKKAKDKDTKEEVALRNQLRKAEQQIADLQAEIREGKTLVARLQAELKKEQKGDVADSKTIAGLSAQLASIRGAKQIHLSLWKKKSDTIADDLTAFATDAPRMFAGVKVVRAVWAGKPTGSGSADVMLVLVFDDAAGYERHKSDPQTKAFHAKYDAKFEPPTVMDFTTK